METQSQTIGKISAALTKFQSKMKGVKRTSDNPFFKSKYAELSDVWDEIRDGLAGVDLSVVQRCVAEGDNNYLVTTLAHSSGEWFAGKMKLTPVKPNDPQASGSAHTYARRYELMGITGIAPIDDDGNAASGKNGAGVATVPQAAQTPAKSNPGAVQGGSTPPIKRLTSSFKLDEPKKSKGGKIFRKAMDSEGATYFVWDDAVCLDLQVAGDQTVTVEYEAGNYPKIVRVVPNDAKLPEPPVEDQISVPF